MGTATAATYDEALGELIRVGLKRDDRYGAGPQASVLRAHVLFGPQALDFLIRNDNLVEGKTVYLKGTIIMTGATLYELVLVYEAQNYSDSDYSRFGQLPRSPLDFKNYDDTI
jgi:hypothetical protein